jgi:glycosyltransferase involved in cell wall biosynthesis
MNKIANQHQFLNMKTVSVIIPTYNRQNRIERTIASVLGQDYKKVEIIVVDDGSTDDTESIVNRIIECNIDADKIVRYIRQMNQGACAARNRGMMLASGDYVMFLDSDDLIKPTKLSIQVKQIENENSQCSICDFECINDTDKIVGNYNNNRHPHDFIRKLVSPHISTVLMKKDSLPAGLKWDASLKRIQDMDFIFKYFASVESWSYVNQTLFSYCLHGDERISDSYIKGIQYGTLIKSFKSYIEDNKNFVTQHAEELYCAYKYALRKHQVRNFLVTLVPISFRKSLKRHYANPDNATN